MVNHFLQRELLALVRHRPAHAAQVVEHRFRHEAHALVEGHRGRVLALGQLALVRITQQRHVAQLRLVPAKILVKQNQFRRRWQPFFATQYVGDAHQVVIDYVGQEVGRQPVGLHQDLHVHAVPRDFDFATQHVRHHADAFGRHFHADHVRLAGIQTALDFLFGEQQGPTVVTRGFALGLLLGAHLVEFFGGAETREGMAQLDQLLRVFLVDIAPFALPIRAVWAADVRTFAPFDAQPAQCVENLLFGLAGRAQLIGVFNAQNELAAMLFGKAVVEQRDVGRAYVWVTGGRWRDAGTNGGHGKSRMRSIKRGMLTGWGHAAPAWVM
ncbi:DNA-binding transcriptional response regulator [Pseudomonas syringae pv. actinidiae]|uniref:DNA-binding transcriptional response regulator n=1 Tax=Pseudomonas syringae pv. actinidiae TaxID=103796 RepID=A0A2V0QKD8_PSESF|nr:DNA-binding transcriptional response regulator [Pseudomonas syringae pv. actinidiae]